MKTAYLIYRPVLDYEESEESYAISLTREGAEAIQKQMLDFANDLLAKMPVSAVDDFYEADREDAPYMPDETSREEFNDNVIDARSALLKEAKWPLGISLEMEFNCYASPKATLRSGIVEIRELPLV